MEICSRCKKEFNPNESKYLCGYGKCSTCCGECSHRNYPNPKYVHDVHRNVLAGFFEKQQQLPR